MKAFVFSVKSLNAEDFEIIIELLSNQTIEDVFIAIKNDIGFTDNELASFYLLCGNQKRNSTNRYGTR